MSQNSSLIREVLSAGEGIVRLAPCWVPRSFLMPGGRLKLDSRDLYALGAHRGGIDERWFSSTTNADNGPGTPACYPYCDRPFLRGCLRLHTV